MASLSGKGHNQTPLWKPFLVSAGVMALLCFAGSRFENIGNHSLRFIIGKNSLFIPSGWFILLFAITWLTDIALLISFPRGITGYKASAVIFGLAFLYRLILLLQGPLNLTHQNPFSFPPPIFKLTIVLFDMGTLGLLMALLRSRCLEIRWSILYAFNPVILYAFAGQGHTDSVRGFFLLAALFFYDRRQPAWMFLSAGLAVQFNWVVATTLPFLFCRDNWKYSWIAAMAVFIPFLLFRYSDLNIFHTGPTQFIQPQVFSGSINVLFLSFFEDTAVITGLSFAFAATVSFFGYRFLHPRRSAHHRNDPVSGCFFALGACLLFSPVCPFWYLAWVIPFLAMRPFASWMLLCLTVSGSFMVSGSMQGAGGQSVYIWAQLLEWIPFWLLFSRDIYLGWHRLKAPADSVPPNSISAVIPVLNETDRIASCIETIKRNPATQEIIVVDGGSTDDTIQRAQECGAKTIQLAPNENRGRGGQIHVGIQEASGDVVVIVHADTRVSEPMLQRMLDFLVAQPMFVGGALGSLFDSRSRRFRFLELANDARMVFLGISFGDQVQFFRRKPVVESELFPDIPLMEDVEFSLRLHRLGRQTFFFGDAMVSIRKWQERGMRHALTVIRLFSAYMVQRLWKTPDTLSMFRKYYKDKSV